MIRQGEKDTQSGTENGKGHRRSDRRNRYGDLLKKLTDLRINDASVSEICDHRVCVEGYNK